MKKERFTLEQHRKAGAMLKRMHNDLTTLRGDVVSAFPLKGHGGKAGNFIARAAKALEEACHHLDEQMTQDDRSVTKLKGWKDIYYGSKE